MTLLQDSDQANLMTDPAITLVSTDGRTQHVVPYKLNPQVMIRRDAIGRPPAPGNPPPTPLVAQQAPVPLPPNGTPISVAAQMKRMQPTMSISQMRMNGGMRPPPSGIVGTASIPPSVSGSQSSPPHVSSLPQPQVNGINGIHRNGGVPSQHDGPKSDVGMNPPIANGVPMSQGDLHPPVDMNGVNGMNGLNGMGMNMSPMRPKSQNQQHHINGYHLAALNGYTNGSPYLHHPNSQQQHNGLSMQQLQNLKSTFAAIQGPIVQDMNGMQQQQQQQQQQQHANGVRQMAGGVNVNGSGAYMGHVMGANFDLQQLGAGANMIVKLPPSRQIPWPSTGVSASGANNNNGNGVDAMAAAMMNGAITSPSHVHTLAVPPVPTRTPSANGSRITVTGMRGHAMGVPVGQMVSQQQQQQQQQHALSPLLPHHNSPVSSPIQLSLPLSLSQQQNPSPPPRLLVSPSLQHQPSVVSSQSGY
jgi:enhancer of polycomb-like protein